jgi:hypothetical protein
VTHHLAEVTRIKEVRTNHQKVIKKNKKEREHNLLLQCLATKTYVFLNTEPSNQTGMTNLEK